MTRIFIDGFEHGGLDLWDTIGGSAAINSSLSGRDGNYCLDCLGQGTAQKYLIKIFSSKSGLYVAFRFYPTNSNRFFTFYNGTTKLGYVNLTALGGNIRAYRGDGTLLATGTATVNSSTWYLIEIYYKPADSGGAFQVKVNGTSDISYSGDTTPGATTIDRIMVGNDDGNWPPGYYDNVILDDATWIGDTKIQAIKPTSAGNSAEWTPSSGSNWDCVEEIPPSDSDYNYTNTNDEIDLFTFQDLSGSIESIKCVQVQARAKYEGAPTPTKLQLGVRRSSTNYVSGSKDLTTAFKQHFHIWEQDPSTSAAWTASGVNAAEFGYKAVA